MATVDFIYDSECPNVKETRANLMRAFARAQTPARWIEHQIGASGSPERVRGFGSPTVLVDGIDVGGLAAGEERCCRLYEGGAVIGVERIVAALRSAASAKSASTSSPRSPGRVRWRSTAAILPGLAVALVPKVVCPLCWPAYAGVLGAVGLTFLMDDRWLMPITGVSLLGALAWRARSRRGYGPLVLGLLSAAALLVGKFAVDDSAIAYAGVASLVLACLWNAWPRRTVEPSCSSCDPNAS